MRWLIGCAVLLSALPAMAAPVTYDLTGIVSQVGTSPRVPVSVGQAIPIVITLDSAFPQTSPGSGQYSFIGGNPTVGFVGPVIAATFNGENLDNFIQTVQVSSAGLSILTTGPQTGTGFQLDLQGSSSSTGGVIPASIDPASLTGGTFFVREAFSVQTFGYSGTIAGGQAVPEPASAALLEVGVLGSLAWSARRRRTA